MTPDDCATLLEHLEREEGSGGRLREELAACRSGEALAGRACIVCLCLPEEGHKDGCILEPPAGDCGLPVALAALPEFP